MTAPTYFVSGAAAMRCTCPASIASARAERIEIA